MRNDECPNTIALALAKYFNDVMQDENTVAIHILVYTAFDENTEQYIHTVHYKRVFRCNDRKECAVGTTAFSTYYDDDIIVQAIAGMINTNQSCRIKSGAYAYRVKICRHMEVNNIYDYMQEILNTRNTTTVEFPLCDIVFVRKYSLREKIKFRVKALLNAFK